MRKALILVITIILGAISLVTLQSIAEHLVLRQGLFFTLGLGLMFLISATRFQDWAALSSWIYWLTNLVLLLLLVFGQATRGTVGWIELVQGFKLQPSQYAVLASALFIAFHIKKLNLVKLIDFLQLLTWILLPALLILLEPDFGTGLIYLISTSVTLLAVKIPTRYWLGLLACTLLALVLVWNFALNTQRRQRITSFLGYEEQESAASYNARQALIAVGSGGIFGRGLGFGVQSHLRFLPERQTDFIFASLAEEWGFVGSGLVIFLYLALCSLLLFISGHRQDQGQQIFVLIITTMLLAQIGVNIGMNLGLAPITGITLPLLSYGGSSIVAIMASLGFVQTLNTDPSQNYQQIK